MFDDNVLMWVAVYGGVILACFWLALIIWAYRDMRSRSRDGFAQVLVAIMVAILNIPGVFIYILLRPKETLAEAYERSLEEEALLQEIEEKPVCPGCGQRVTDDWQVCPSCHTRLKKNCHVCKNLLELPWTVCPYCASPQPQYLPDDQVINASRHVQRTPVESTNIPDKWLANRRSDEPVARPRRTTGDLEFIDNDDY